MPTPMRWLVPLFLVAALAGEARAQCAAGASSCGNGDVDTWMRLGPTISPLLSLQPNESGLSPSAMLRLGIFAGWPIQLETTINAGRSATSFFTGGSAGVRLLAVSWSPVNGLGRGGREGVNVGGIAGIGLVGFYAGPVVEAFVMPELGFVAELQWTVGGVLRQPWPSVQLGIKVQMPAFQSSN